MLTLFDGSARPMQVIAILFRIIATSGDLATHIQIIKGHTLYWLCNVGPLDKTARLRLEVGYLVKDERGGLNIPDTVKSLVILINWRADAALTSITSASTSAVFTGNTHSYATEKQYQVTGSIGRRLGYVTISNWHKLYDATINKSYPSTER